MQVLDKCDVRPPGFPKRLHGRGVPAIGRWPRHHVDGGLIIDGALQELGRGHRGDRIDSRDPWADDMNALPTARPSQGPKEEVNYPPRTQFHPRGRVVKGDWRSRLNNGLNLLNRLAYRIFDLVYPDSLVTRPLLRHVDVSSTDVERLGRVAVSDIEVPTVALLKEHWFRMRHAFHHADHPLIELREP